MPYHPAKPDALCGVQGRSINDVDTLKQGGDELDGTSAILLSDVDGMEGVLPRRAPIASRPTTNLWVQSSQIYVQHYGRSWYAPGFLA